MEDNDYVLAFDHLYTTNHIQILKSLIPFVSAESAGMLPVLIKYMELKYTLSLSKNCTNIHGNIRASSVGNGEAFESLENIHNAIKKYLSPSEDKNLSQMVNVIKTMKSVREMQQMMELLDINLNEASDINEILNMFGGNANGNK
jgi:hypothetical protein